MALRSLLVDVGSVRLMDYVDVSAKVPCGLKAVLYKVSVEPGFLANASSVEALLLKGSAMTVW